MIPLWRTESGRPRLRRVTGYCKLKAFPAGNENRSMADDDSDREQGVDFSAVESTLEAVSYPITADQLIEDHGDLQLERTNADAITIGELLSPMGDTTFESASAVRQMLLNQMPRESVGRAGYSDRGGSLPEETDEAEDAGSGTEG